MQTFFYRRLWLFLAALVLTGCPGPYSRLSQQVAISEAGTPHHEINMITDLGCGYSKCPILAHPIGERFFNLHVIFQDYGGKDPVLTIEGLIPNGNIFTFNTINRHFNFVLRRHNVELVPVALFNNSNSGNVITEVRLMLKSLIAALEESNYASGIKVAPAEVHLVDNVGEYGPFFILYLRKLPP